MLTYADVCWRSGSRARQHTSAYASIRQYTPAYVSIRRARQRPFAMEDARYVASYLRVLAYLQRARVDGGEARRYRLLAYIRQHTSAYVSIRQLTSAYARE